jgi:hypothetical protein
VKKAESLPKEEIASNQRNPQKPCQALKPPKPIKTNDIPIAKELSPIHYN